MMHDDDDFPDGPYRPAHWPEWARDEIFSDVTVRFDWTDRLLILLGATFVHEMTCDSDFCVGSGDEHSCSGQWLPCSTCGTEERVG